LQEGTNQPEFSEVSPVKVIGSIRFDNIFTLKVFNTFILLRTQGKKKHIMAFKISPVPTQEEYDAHMEIVYSHLKLRQLQQKINGQIGASDASISNSMMGGGLGIQVGAVTSSAGKSLATRTMIQVWVKNWVCQQVFEGYQLGKVNEKARQSLADPKVGV
jgi:hypothetical protein